MNFYNSDFDYNNEFIENWNEKVKRIKSSCIVIAIVLLIAGILCFAFPMKVYTFIQYLVAVTLIVTGIFHIVNYVNTTYYFRDSMQIIVGVLNILMGVLILFMPVIMTSTALTFLLAFLLLITGAETLSFAGRMRYYRIMNTGVMTFGGIVSIIISVLFLLMPFFASLVLNYIIAAYLAVSGILLLTEALSMKKVE